jgi:hypothetical protein
MTKPVSLSAWIGLNFFLLYPIGMVMLGFYMGEMFFFGMVGPEFILIYLIAAPLTLIFIRQKPVAYKIWLPLIVILPAALLTFLRCLLRFGFKHPMDAVLIPGLMAGTILVSALIFYFFTGLFWQLGWLERLSPKETSQSQS